MYKIKLLINDYIRYKNEIENNILPKWEISKNDKETQYKYELDYINLIKKCYEIIQELELLESKFDSTSTELTQKEKDFIINFKKIHNLIFKSNKLIKKVDIPSYTKTYISNYIPNFNAKESINFYLKNN